MEKDLQVNPRVMVVFTEFLKIAISLLGLAVNCNLKLLHQLSLWGMIVGAFVPALSYSLQNVTNKKITI